MPGVPHPLVPCCLVPHLLRALRVPDPHALRDSSAVVPNVHRDPRAVAPWVIGILPAIVPYLFCFLRALVSHVHQALRLLLPRMPCAVIFPVNHVLCASRALCFMYPHTLWVFFLCTLFNASYLKYSMCQYYSLCLLSLTHLFYCSLPSCDLFGGIYLS